MPVVAERKSQKEDVGPVQLQREQVPQRKRKAEEARHDWADRRKAGEVFDKQVKSGGGIRKQKKKKKREVVSICT